MNENIKNGKYELKSGDIWIDNKNTVKMNCTIYYKDGKIHKEDGPAIEWEDGSKYWYCEGHLHRKNKPAVIQMDGLCEWWENGNFVYKKIIDQTSVKELIDNENQIEQEKEITLYGFDSETKAEIIKIKNHYGFEYRKYNHRLHREDGPAVEKFDGTKEWYRNGEVHRENGPAIELKDGTKKWYRYNNLHREDGPAIEYSDGRKRWFLYGDEYNQKEYEKEIGLPINELTEDMTPADIFNIPGRWIKKPNSNIIKSIRSSNQELNQNIKSEIFKK